MDKYAKCLKNIFIITLILSVVGCSGLFNNSDNGPNFDFQTSQAQSQKTTFNGDSLVFEPLQPDEQPAGNPPFISEVNGSQITIEGYYLASAGFSVLGEFVHEDNTTKLIVRADPGDDTAPSMPQGYFYDAFINNFSEGSHTVTIIHKNDLMVNQDGHQVPAEDTVFTKEFTMN